MRGLWTLAMALVAVAVVAVAALALAQMYGRAAVKDYSYDYYLLKRAAANARRTLVRTSPGQCPEPRVNQTVVYVDSSGRAIGFAADWRRGDLRYYFYLCLVAKINATTARGEPAYAYYAVVKHGVDPLPALSVTDGLGRRVPYALVARLGQGGAVAAPILVVLAPGDVGFCAYDYPFGGCVRG